LAAKQWGGQICPLAVCLSGAAWAELVFDGALVLVALLLLWWLAGW